MKTQNDPHDPTRSCAKNQPNRLKTKPCRAFRVTFKNKHFFGHNFFNMRQIKKSQNTKVLSLGPHFIFYRDPCPDNYFFFRDPRPGCNIEPFRLRLGIFRDILIQF
jgi:hypothetical protein